MTSAAPHPADGPEPAIKASSAPGTISPAPRLSVASDGRPSTLSDCAGGAKMRGLVHHAGRGARCAVILAPNSRKPSPITTGRTARSGRDRTPATQRATPMVLGARARMGVHRLGRKPRTRLSHPSGATCQGPDGIGAGLSGFLLPLLAQPRHLPMQEIRILPSNAGLKKRQQPSRVCRVVVSVFSCVATSHARNKAWGSAQHVQKKSASGAQSHE